LRLQDHTQETPPSLGLLWKSDQSDAETPTDKQQHSQATDIHVFGGILIHNPSKRPAVDARLRPRRPLVSAKINLASFKYTPFQSCEKRLLSLPCPSVRPSVRPSAEKNSTPLEVFFVKFHIEQVCYISKKFRFSYNRRKISDTIHDNVSTSCVSSKETGLRNRKLTVGFSWQHI